MSEEKFKNRCIVTNLVIKAWQLPNRPDLLKDCIEFVAVRYETTDGHDYITHLIIKFLSSHSLETNFIFATFFESIFGDNLLLYNSFLPLIFL